MTKPCLQRQSTSLQQGFGVLPNGSKCPVNLLRPEPPKLHDTISEQRAVAKSPGHMKQQRVTRLSNTSQLSQSTCEVFRQACHMLLLLCMWAAKLMLFQLRSHQSTANSPKGCYNVPNTPTSTILISRCYSVIYVFNIWNNRNPSQHVGFMRDAHGLHCSKENAAHDSPHHCSPCTSTLSGIAV